MINAAFIGNKKYKKRFQCNYCYIYLRPLMTKESESAEKFREMIPQLISVFMTYGIKSMTMDDIARQLRISKKTLYQYVSDKRELVMRCMEHDCVQNEHGVREIVSRGLNAVEENFEISKHVLKQLREIHPSIFYDLEKYYPEAWAMLHESKDSLTAEVIRANLNKGIKEGFFRDDIDIEIHTRLWITRMNVIFDPQLFPIQEFSIPEVYEQMFIHQIRGIANQKGIEYFEQFYKKQAKSN